MEQTDKEKEKSSLSGLETEINGLHEGMKSLQTLCVDTLDIIKVGNVPKSETPSPDKAARPHGSNRIAEACCKVKDLMGLVEMITKEVKEIKDIVDK